MQFPSFLLIRPPDIVCRRTYILPVFLLLLSFFRRLISEVAKRNSTKIGHMVGSKCNLKTHVQNLGCPPTNRGPQNHLFGPLRNLTATLTAYIFGTKYDIDNRSSALTTTRCLLHRAKMSWTLIHKQLQTRRWSTNGSKPDRRFYPPSLFCFVTVHYTPFMRH